MEEHASPMLDDWRLSAWMRLGKPTAGAQYIRPDLANAILDHEGGRMIRTIKVLFCEDEHGMGDRTFPDLMDLDTRMFVDGVLTAAQLRKLAKEHGWTRSGGADYCNICSAGATDPLNNDD
jgi:hypothetical protein